MLAVSVNDRTANNHIDNYNHHINANWDTARGCKAIRTNLFRILEYWDLSLCSVFVEYYYIPPSYADGYYNHGMATLLEMTLELGADVHIMQMPGSATVSRLLLQRDFECIHMPATDNALLAATKDALVTMNIEGNRGTTEREPPISLRFMPKERDTGHNCSQSDPMSNKYEADDKTQIMSRRR
jgi:hypothetical protein